jgi:hypothetical protein
VHAQPSRASNPACAAGTLPELPDHVWTLILEIRAAISIQAHYKGFKVRIGPLRWVLRSIRKGALVRTRAAYRARGAAGARLNQCMSLCSPGA